MRHPFKVSLFCLERFINCSTECCPAEEPLAATKAPALGRGWGWVRFANADKVRKVCINQQTTEPEEDKGI